MLLQRHITRAVRCVQRVPTNQRNEQSNVRPALAQTIQAGAASCVPRSFSRTTKRNGTPHKRRHLHLSPPTPCDARRPRPRVLELELPARIVLAVHPLQKVLAAAAAPRDAPGPVRPRGDGEDLADVVELRGRPWSIPREEEEGQGGDERDVRFAP